MRPTEKFREATKKFDNLIEQRGLSTDILWLFREDVTAGRWGVYIRWPVTVQNHRLAEELYERGRNKGLGVWLNVFCLVGNRPCCYIWVPEDEIDAEHAMLVDLKVECSNSPDKRVEDTEPVALDIALLVELKTGMQ